MRRVRIGLTLPQGWLDEFPSKRPNGQFLFCKRVAQAAERLGYDAGYVYDHFVPYYGNNTGGPFLEAYMLLSAIASVTSRLRIGQVVTCNSYRHPSLLAKMTSTLDAISNGRLEFGIGAGWFEKEYASYGYRFDAAADRIEQLDESISIIRRMWTRERASFEGRHYFVKNAACSPKPVQVPHPPVMVGGGGRKLMGVVARHATRYNHPFGTPEILAEKLGMLGSKCREIRRDPDEIESSVLLRVLVGRDRDEVRSVISALKKKNESVTDFILRSRDSIALGTPDEVAGYLERYRKIGITYFIVNFVGLSRSLGMLSTFSRRVAPKIR